MITLDGPGVQRGTIAFIQPVQKTVLIKRNLRCSRVKLREGPIHVKTLYDPARSFRKLVGDHQQSLTTLLKSKLMEQNDSESKSYLTFKLGDEEFGAHVSQVLNILEMTRITDVPQSPEYMKGVINLRGSVLPVIDTRIKFGLAETQYTQNTCIVVMDIDFEGETLNLGAIVDEVLSVVEIQQDQVEPPPSLGSQYHSEFIDGMAKVDDHFVMLIDMQKVLNSDELAGIAETSRHQAAEEPEN